MTNTSTLTILLADDDFNISQMYTRALEKQHIKVETAYDGEEALNKLSHNSFDLVLIDIMMPTKSGIDIIRELNLDGAGKNVPVIILSNLTPSDVPPDVREHAVRYLVKADTTPSKLAAEIQMTILPQLKQYS